MKPVVQGLTSVTLINTIVIWRLWETRNTVHHHYHYTQVNINSKGSKNGGSTLFSPREDLTPFFECSDMWFMLSMQMVPPILFLLFLHHNRQESDTHIAQIPLRLSLIF